MWRSTLGGLAVAACLAAPAAAQFVKVATFVPEQSVGVSGVIKPWMESVSAELPEGVTMQGFWGGTLGKNPFKQFELVQNGVADVTWVLPGYTAGQFPEMSIFELPFLFANATEASLVGWRLYERGLFSGLDGVELVGFFASEPSNLYMAEPISGLEDLQGKKIRSVGEIHAKWLDTVGAAPQTLASTEMNEALTRGVIDGVIQSWTGMRTFGTIDLVAQDYEVPVGVIPFLLLMNEETFEALPAEAQAAMLRHGAEKMAEMGGAAYRDVGAEIKSAVLAEDKMAVDQPDPETMERYREQALETHRWWIENTPNGQAVYDAALEEIAKIRGS